MATQKPIDIVITTWQREWMTELCLMALRLNTTTPYRLIIIDNGSSAQFQTKYLHASDIYIKMDYNRGLESVKNLAMNFVESELFVSMDNDILVYQYKNPDWLGGLVDLMNRNPEYGAIAPKPQILVGTGMRMFEAGDELVEFPHVPGYARLMRTGWVNAAGAWGDKRPSRGHEELWMGEKFKEKGWKMGWAGNIQCWHLFGEDDTDEWGYLKGAKPEDHGHAPIWPMPKNDKEEIRKGVGIEI